jgi:hypothetical protein
VLTASSRSSRAKGQLDQRVVVRREQLADRECHQLVVGWRQARAVSRARDELLREEVAVPPGGGAEAEELRGVERALLAHEALHRPSLALARRRPQLGEHPLDEHFPGREAGVVSQRRWHPERSAPEGSPDADREARAQEDHDGARVVRDAATQLGDG